MLSSCICIFTTLFTAALLARALTMRAVVFTQAGSWRSPTSLFTRGSSPSCRCTVSVSRSKKLVSPLSLVQSQRYCLRVASRSTNKSGRYYSRLFSVSSSSSSSSATTGDDDNNSSSSDYATSTLTSPRIISYLTDVEGDRDYLARYVQQSKVLTFRKTKPNMIHGGGNDSLLYFPYDHCIDFQPDMKDNACLVFGGDVWDQGGSDLYVIRQLLHFQQRFPDRVHLVMGNRDINKMRMIAELGEPGSLTAPPHRGVFRLRSNSRATESSSSSIEPNALSRDPVERLQWILAKTMGSPRAFEHRRWELSQERQLLGQGDPVTDADVVESYRISCHPILGEMGQYLSQAKLVVRLGEALFIHGSLPITSEMLVQQEDGDDHHLWTNLTPLMPWLVPGERARDVGVETIDNWFSALNDFSRIHVEGWKEHNVPVSEFWSSVGGYNHAPQPYSSLMQYGMGWLPGGVRNPTIVYSSWSTDGMPQRFFPESNAADKLYVALTREFLERTGVRLICSGHQPQGDAPNVIRIDLDGKQRPAYILSCDTSYSGDIKWHNLPSDSHPRSNRGRELARSGRGLHAVSEVLIEQCSQSGELLKVYFHGTLSDGTSYEAEPLSFNPNAGIPVVVGTLTPALVAPSPEHSPHNGPWWSRAILNDGSLLISSGVGFNSWNRIVKP